MNGKNDPQRDLSKGEGNREADRRYREGATDFADTELQKEKAREAAEEVEETS